ncbi:tRNA 5-methoxyuridine(34)/uridine 5-oxyacetic acid(34) synthase CmoB [Idiomarina xiamenensis]|uniref:tRNA U34 carboxymethyltransferase n=1 Tax=Idiomarina xiamenensis 10-D-4 TaxID=740709 RepID=K2JBZ2_9GAMM|nr:tRNA 5-methoxyuridine(34)/uridine 5-oxyacetic acid(34) synthase CmoB [Idiomarina xiamenensis]EKE80796.1 tRNA mo(5)U34 methyltransferase [Idiomarina xiamenensis 10-D-4]
MSLFRDDLQALLNGPLHPWLAHVAPQLASWQQQPHGDFKRWQRVLAQLPALKSDTYQLGDTVSVGNIEQASDSQRAQLQGLLKQLMPWRKGPFELFGLHIDTEWRSDWKWQRIAPHLGDLSGQQVLDVGCGSGYHLWRMLESGADHAWGIDPGELFLTQFQAIRSYMPAAIAKRAHFFPLGVEHLPTQNNFDTVFSMGVLYHRRSPIDFLYQLRHQLKRGGQLVLETIISEGDEHHVFMPGERYAKMRNVWYLPSTGALSHWLKRCGFSEIELLDVSTTTTDEQRRTPWMENESLADFIDPNRPNLTIEGYAAPRRAVFRARRA